MAPTDSDVSLRFLVSCIRHSNGGKVDFEEVRKECDIVTKAAAAKRYERLLKSHGITPGAVSGVKREAKDTDDNKKTKRPRANKRKLEEVNEDEGDVDEPVKSEPKVKAARRRVAKKPSAIPTDDEDDDDSI